MRPPCLAIGVITLFLAAPRAHAQTFGRWHVAGPFPHPQGPNAMEPAQLPERALKLMLAGKEGPDLAAPITQAKMKGEGARSWIVVDQGPEGGRSPDVGVLDLAKLCDPKDGSKGWDVNAAAYLYRRIDCDGDVEWPVCMGSDDGLRFWFNGELLIDRPALRALTLEDHQIVLHLKPGANHLLAKVVNAAGPWSFQMAPWKRIDQKEIDRAIDRGVRCLIEAQLPDGTWGMHDEYGAGHTSFTAYTLLKSGVPADDPALQLAFAAMDARPSEHTYSAACLVLALAATHDARWKPRIQEAVQDLIGWQGGQALLSYPILPNYSGTLPPDLSNTLYAALAYRAAEREGIDVPDKVWADLATGTLRCLCKETSSTGVATGKSATTKAAGFSYRVGTNEATGSMTTAGLSILALAQEGTQGKLPPATTQRIQSAVAEGLAWLDLNMQWFQNPGQNAHHYFWIYGVERAGTLLGIDVLGGVDWYWSGAAYLVKKQRANGSWSSGGTEADEPIDTLLALLFLERATVPVTGTVLTGHERRKSGEPTTRDAGKAATSWEAGSAQDELLIHARGESRTVLWTSTLRDDVARAIAGPRGIEVKDVEFFARFGGDPSREVVLGVVPGKSMAADDLRTLELVHVFDKPGTWTVWAKLHVLVAGTQPRTIATPELSFAVHDVFDTRRLAYVSDVERDVWRGIEMKVEASSNAAATKNVIDGRYETSWQCDAKDASPWIRLTPPRPMQIDHLAFTHALPRPRDATKPRAMEIEAVINGETKLKATLDADCRIKTELALPPRTPLRTIELRILSARDGKLGDAALGFSEIEAFATR